LTAKFRNEYETKHFEEKKKFKQYLFLCRIKILKVKSSISTPLNTALKLGLIDMLELEKMNSVAEFKNEFEKGQKANNIRQENINPTPTSNSLSSLPRTLTKVTIGSWSFCDSCLTLNEPDAKKCANCDQDENLANNENGKDHLFCL
jgi:hypothetical protein